MQGLKELVEYCNELAKPNIIDMSSGDYSDKKLYRVDEELRAETLNVSTLSSLIGFVKADIDRPSEKIIIQIVSPTEVRLISTLDGDRKREVTVCATADIPSFPFGKYISTEAFTIGLQSKFLDVDNRSVLLKFAGTVKSETISQYGDDGVTQRATIKSGVASVVDTIVPSPAKLKPYRTFTEVEQPSSEFIFRMKEDKYEGIQCALFEADGGAWKREAMKNIHNHLEFELSDFLNDLIIIS